MIIAQREAQWHRTQSSFRSHHCLPLLTPPLQITLQSFYSTCGSLILPDWITLLCTESSAIIKLISKTWICSNATDHRNNFSTTWILHLLVYNLVCKKYSVNSKNCTQFNRAVQECTKHMGTYLKHSPATSVHCVHQEPLPPTSGVPTFHPVQGSLLLLLRSNSQPATLPTPTYTSKLQVFFNIQHHIIFFFFW